MATTTFELDWDGEIVLDNNKPNRLVIRPRKRSDGGIALEISIYDSGEGAPEEKSSN